MKFVVGQSYKLGTGRVVTYSGTLFIHCDRCNRLSYCRTFVNGPLDNPREQYFFGNECVKKAVVDG